MTVKLWLVSMVLSVLAPIMFPRLKKKKDERTDSYHPGRYFDHTMSLKNEDQLKK